VAFDSTRGPEILILRRGWMRHHQCVRIAQISPGKMHFLTDIDMSCSLQKCGILFLQIAFWMFRFVPRSDMRISVPFLHQVRNVTEREGAVLPVVFTSICLHPHMCDLFVIIVHHFWWFLVSCFMYCASLTPLLQMDT
jgi:hypothetical protein